MNFTDWPGSIVAYALVDQAPQRLGGYARAIAERFTTAAGPATTLFGRIVATEVEALVGWLRGADVAPTVAALRSRADEVVEAELRRLGQRRPDLTTDQRSEIAHSVHRVVQRLLHSPTVRVRQLAAEPGGDQYAALLRELFDLEVPQTAQADDVPGLGADA